MALAYNSRPLPSPSIPNRLEVAIRNILAGVCAISFESDIFTAHCPENQRQYRMSWRDAGGDIKPTE